MLKNLAFAQDHEAKLTNITVTNTRDDLLLYFNVEGTFREETKKAILNGIPMSLTFSITLYKVNDFWIDNKLAEITTNHTIKYDNLKKEFIIIHSSASDSYLVIKSFEEAWKLMTRVDRLKIISLLRLKKGEKYQIRAKAEPSEFTLPFYLHYVPFFASPRDFETNWHTIDFIY